MDRGFKFRTNEMAQLRAEASEALRLAAEFDDPASISDLVEYSAALDAMAAVWPHADELSPPRNSFGPH